MSVREIARSSTNVPTRDELAEEFVGFHRKFTTGSHSSEFKVARERAYRLRHTYTGVAEDIREAVKEVVGNPREFDIHPQKEFIHEDEEKIQSALNLSAVHWLSAIDDYLE